MAASSLLLPTISPKTLISSKPKTLTLSLSSTNHLSLSYFSSSFSSFPLLKKGRNFDYTIVRKVAVSSEFGQEEDEEEEEVLSGDEGSFSADLKLFVGNLPFNVDSAELAGLFGRAGNVELVEVIYDKQTGKSRGFGFVTMSTVGEVEAAAQQFNGYELQGRALRVNSGPPPPRREEFPSRGFRGGGREEFSSRGFRGGGREEFPSRGFRGGGREEFSSGGFRGGGREEFSSGGFRGGGNSDASNRVYVGNLSWNVDDSALETLFSEQGKVMDAKVVYDRESGRSRGFGFVTYSNAQEVNNAISSLDGSDLDGRSIRVTVAEARARRQF